VKEREHLEATLDLLVKTFIDRWAKGKKGQVLDDAALNALRIEAIKLAIAVAAGITLACTGVAVEAAADQIGSKVQ
jgi:hypothetical protein